MKLNEYIQKLQEIVNENPEAEQLEAVYGIDDEGNAFHPVVHNPTVGYYFNNEFYDREYMKEEDEIENHTPNAICIN